MVSTMNRAWRLLRQAILLSIATAFSGCSEDPSPVTGPPAGLAGYHLIALASDRGSTQGLTDIYLYDVDMRGIIPLAGLNHSGSSERDPAISGEGQRLFFASDRNQPGDSEILAYDLKDRMFLGVPNVNTSLSETEPAPSGDGLHLAFVRRYGTVDRILLAEGWPPALPVSLPVVGTVPYSDFSPSCDSTARRIAFTTDRAGNLDVMVWDRDSAGVLTLPDLASPDEDVEPWITPSGRFLAFASNRPSTGGGYNIYLYDLEARTFVSLPGLQSDGEDRHPSLSWDAQRIAFQSSRSGGAGMRDVWIYERAQALVRATLSSPRDDLQPFMRYK